MAWDLRWGPGIELSQTWEEEASHPCCAGGFSAKSKERPVGSGSTVAVPGTLRSVCLLLGEPR